MHYYIIVYKNRLLLASFTSVEFVKFVATMKLSNFSISLALIFALTLVKYAQTTEEEKQKADLLMTELAKRDSEIRETLRTQLARIAGELRRSYDKRPDKNYVQWVVATPLRIERAREGAAEPLILTKELVSDDQIYSNFAVNSRRREDLCNRACLRNIAALPTKRKASLLLQNDHVIHTEIQMMYRQSENILTKQENENKIILVYSKYIPCAQNQGARGGVFLECAGEMANFVVNNNPKKVRFIVFYEEVHDQTISPVAKLYMEMSGIIVFKYTSNTNRLQRAARHCPRFATHLRTSPKFIRLGRPLLSDAYKTTSTQLFVDCIARNNFVLAIKSSSRVQREVQFIAAKSQLYKVFAMNSDNLHAVYEKGFEKGANLRQKGIIEGCYRFAIRMYESPKTSAIMVNEKTTDYLAFGGTPSRNMETTKFVQTEKVEYCEKFLPPFIAYFDVARRKQQTCGYKD